MRPAELLERHPRAWQAATRHPFLDAIRAGTLPEAAFRAWLDQDHLFVSDLLVFQARLLSVAPRGAQAVLAGGLVALEAELGWFEANGANAAGRHPVTAAYRDHLLSLTQDFKDGLTALWTGERAYLEAWRSAAPGAEPYREFVEHWTVPEFAAYVADLEGALDSAGAEEAAFLRTCELERDFWGMAWSASATA